MEQKTPLVSVIIPVYNTGESALSLLDDIENNTYKNIEIILIDDGSSDDSVKILKKYISEHKGLKIKLITQKNSGPSGARNSGIKISHGEYIIFIDSDDNIKKDHIKNLVNAICDPNTDLAICGIKIHYLESNSNSIDGIRSIKKQGKNETRANFILRLLLSDGRFYVSTNKIYRREIIQQNQLKFDEKMNFAEDLKFNLYYVIYASGDIKFIQKATYVYKFGTETSTVKKSSLIKTNWQKSFNDLKDFVRIMRNNSNLNIHRRRCLFIRLHQEILTTIRLILVFMRWKVSHAHSVIRTQKTFKARTKYINPAYLIIILVLLKVRYILKLILQFVHKSIK